MSGTLATIFGLWGGRKWMTRDGRNGISRTGSGAPIASGRKKSFGGRTGCRLRPDCRGMAGRHRRFAPLWVYFFGLFAFAVLQRLLFPPDEHR